MSYRTILLLNLASFIEACILKLLIDSGLIVCNMPTLTSLYHVLALVAVKNMLVIGGYQMYFWPQNNHNPSKKIYLKPTSLDRLIPAVPEVFWIYSPAYYLFFGLAILCLKNYHITALNAWIMLMHSSFWFINFPTAVDQEFRKGIRKVPTDRLTKYIMDMVHAHDTEDNACPSMHCAFAVFLAFITYPFYPTLSTFFPLVVALSCLLSKQHLLIDILPGFLLGAIHGFLNMLML
jgi:membrane-associated phospholipid phosphatase